MRPVSPFDVRVRRVHDEPSAADGARVLRPSAEPAEPEGGEAACFAHLVCPECGAVVSEGHGAGCGLAGAATP
jgi:hypothetical protein